MGLTRKNFIKCLIKNEFDEYDVVILVYLKNFSDRKFDSVKQYDRQYTDIIIEHIFLLQRV